MAPGNSKPETLAIKLWHGTTLHRAQSLLIKGPYPHFKEPGGKTSEPAFFMARPEGPFSQGNPTVCARGKAAIFDEGGPAILEVEIPMDGFAKAMDLVAEVIFGPGYGLEELQSTWPSLAKNIVPIAP